LTQLCGFYKQFELGIDFEQELLYSGLTISDKNYLRIQVLENK